MRGEWEDDSHGPSRAEAADLPAHREGEARPGASPRGLDAVRDDRRPDPGGTGMNRELFVRRDRKGRRADPGQRAAQGPDARGAGRPPGGELGGGMRPRRRRLRGRRARAPAAGRHRSARPRPAGLRAAARAVALHPPALRSRGSTPSIAPCVARTTSRAIRHAVRVTLGMTAVIVVAEAVVVPVAAAMKGRPRTDWTTTLIWAVGSLAVVAAGGIVFPLICDAMIRALRRERWRRLRLALYAASVGPRRDRPGGRRSPASSRSTRVMAPCSPGPTGSGCWRWRSSPRR